jgi:putative intracellular protease/amidase
MSSNTLLGTMLASMLILGSAHAEERFTPYVPQKHARPVVAVIGDNDGTELTDFVIPYAVLKRSGAVDAFAVSTRPGTLRMRPAAVRLKPDMDAHTFDARFSEGADYIIVPAIVRNDDAALLEWVRAQHARGAMVLSICDGALVVANSGVLDGHRATAHWATESHRRKMYPQITWVANTRYVVDGRVASSSGISASIPASLALLESIVGTEKARTVGAEFGVTSWSPEHDSDRFHPRAGNLLALAKVVATNKWFHAGERVDVPLTPGFDDVAVALTADAWSRTGRSQAHGVGHGAEVRSRAGLVWLTDGADDSKAKHRLDATQPPADVPLFDGILETIAARYGLSTAKGVAIDFEYPWAAAGR